MFNKVVFATDFSESSQKIVNILANYKNIFKEIIPVRVVNINKVLMSVFSDIDEWIQREKTVSEEMLLELTGYLREMGFKVDLFYIPVGDPATEIVHVAEKVKASLIIMGSRGRSVLKTILLGSVAEGVLRKSKIPIIIIKGNNINIFHKILYVHYPLEVDEEMLKYLKTMAKAGGKYILLLHVVEPMLPPESTSNLMISKYERAKDVLECLKDQLKKHGIDVKSIVRLGQPHKEILRIAQEENVTMIALRPQIKKGLFSSTTEIVVRRSKVPVFIYKR